MRVRLERPAALHLDEFVAAVRRSRGLHGDFVAPPDTRQGYRRFVKQARLGGEVRFLSITADDARLAGVVTIGAIARSSEQSASIGYYAFEPYAGRGLMSEAVALAVRYAFGRLGLQRLDASIRPDNPRSLRLARRLGFRSDGLALHEVRIGGRWYAHERWALHADEWERATAGINGRLGPRRADGGIAQSVELNCGRPTK